MHNSSKRIRAELASLSLIIAVTFAGVVFGDAPALATLSFKAPWTCGVTWHASTYTGHVGNAVDFNNFADGSDAGAPVLASASGTVALVPWDSDVYQYGNMVKINHGDGWETRYAHLASFAAMTDRDPSAAGVQVNQRDLLGYVGDTEAPEGAHLHYEQRLNNNGQNVAFDGAAIAVGTSYNTSDPTHTSTNCAPPVTDPLPDGTAGGSIASSRGSGRIDLFLQGSNPSGANMHRNLYAVPGPWQGWVTAENSGTYRITSTPATTSWSQDRIDVFARGENGDLVHKWYTSSYGWSYWESLGGCLIGAPAVTSWAEGRLDVFIRGCNASGPNLWHLFYEAGWHAWGQVSDGTGVRMASSPAAISWGPGRIDIVAKGASGELLHKWHQGMWGNWAVLGGCIVGTPAMTSMNTGRLDIFSRACNMSGNNLWHTFYDNGWHGGLTPSGDSTSVTHVLGATSWGPDRLDVFARNSSGHVIHKWYENGTWGNWANLGGETPS